MDSTSRILVIEGDSAWEQALGRWLKDWGHLAVFFSPESDWASAFATDPQGFDLVLVDPGEPGYPGATPAASDSAPILFLQELSAALEASHPGPQIPLLVMTSFGAPGWLDACVASGASDILQKPLQPALLKARLTSWLRHQESREALVIANQELERRVLERTLELQELNSIFLKFVPRQFQERIFKTRKVETGVYELADLTVMFLDVRGFTSFAEERGTSGVVDGLSRLFERIVPIVSDHQGFIDNFSGDSFMAVFEGVMGAENAVAAAVAIQRVLQLPGFAFRVGIGINSGPVVFAAVGSNDRISSTVLGDQVNLCARIEKFTKFMGAQILVADSTWDRIPDGLWKRESRFVDHLKVRGRNKPARIIEIFSGDPDPIREAKAAIRDSFESAIKAYASRDFVTAIEGFRSCLRQFPQDLVSIEYVRRCRYFLKNRPDIQFFERGVREGDEYIDPAVRRRYPRYGLNSGAEFEFLHNDPVLVDQRIRLPGRLIDISVQGLMIESQHCPPQGVVFELRVSFAGTPLEADLGRSLQRFVCQVRWNAPGNPARLGVSFVQLSADDESRLSLALEQAHARGAIQLLGESIS
ncbi:MAG: adenylate/guanylate cyclase domain-containing protein [Oligoflexia bacterium]